LRWIRRWEVAGGDGAGKTKSIKPTETKMRDARPDKWAQREEPGQVPVMVEIGGRLRNFPTAK